MRRTQRIILILCLLATVGSASAERIKDIVTIKGVRDNPLMGYGLVIGLQGTGDDSPVSRQTIASILRRSGITMDPDDLGSKSIASVIVTATLPPFARKGTKIDVTVSTIGNASSLQGGTLLMTPLIGADKETYAVAQGELVVGGFSAQGQSSSVQKNHTSVGNIPSGATIEIDEISDYVENGKVTLQLRNSDFSTSRQIAQAINTKFKGAAEAVDAGSIRVTLPKTDKKDGKSAVTEFISSIGQLKVKVDSKAVVAINEKTGTVIVGENVTISDCAISHGNLSVVRKEKDYASQPEPFSKTGETVKLHRTEIHAIEDEGPMHTLALPKPVSVSDLARSLNAMGLTPRDLISIFQALKKAGKLQAELKVM
ncbi:MAG: flagellar basal body P-ring protein FlgI [Planctomycetota bacterium]